MHSLAVFRVVVVSCAVSCAGLAAGAPVQVCLQGVLQDAGGVPLAGERTWSVQYFDDATSGTALSAPAGGSMTVAPSGRWALSLVPDPAVLAAPQVWYELGIDSAAVPDGAVDPDDLFPGRFRVESVMFALKAADADALGGKAASAIATVKFVESGLLDKADLDHDHEGVYAEVAHRIHGESNTAAGGNAGVGGGMGNQASGSQAFIGGGASNKAEGSSTFIGAGSSNQAGGILSVIVGGYGNIATGDETFIGGGETNLVAAEYSTIGGGLGNIVLAPRATIAGGGLTSMSDLFPEELPNVVFDSWGFIGGGGGNVAGSDDGRAQDTGNASYAVVAGGRMNKALAPYSTVGGGGPRDGAGVATTGNVVQATGSNGTIAGGASNEIQGHAGFIGGGFDNRIIETEPDGSRFGVIAGGISNTLIGRYTTIAGGYRNWARGDEVVIGGGYDNRAVGQQSTVAGGDYNEAGIWEGNWFDPDAPQDPTTTSGATVGGGSYNRARASSATVGGGNSNVADGFASTVAGGDDNTAGGMHSTVGGGVINRALSDNATVGGGEENYAHGVSATVAGGEENDAYGASAAVGGGSDNNAYDDFCTIGGGDGNRAGVQETGLGVVQDTTTAPGATVAGGRKNFAVMHMSTVGGGEMNHAWADFATVAGGGPADLSSETTKSETRNRVVDRYGTVGGGGGNIAGSSDGDQNTAQFATVPGGRSNTAAGAYSFAAGFRAKANHHGAFVWGDNTNADVASEREAQFRVRANGGARFDVTGNGLSPAGFTVNTAGASAVGASITTSSTDVTLFLSNQGTGDVMKAFAGGTQTMQLRNNGNLWIGGDYYDNVFKKKMVGTVEPREVLDKLATVPISTWTSEKDGGSTTHMRANPKEMHAALGLGDNENGVSLGDANGVSLAAIQGLYDIVKEQQATIEALRREVEQLKAAQAGGTQ